MPIAQTTDNLTRTMVETFLKQTEIIISTAPVESVLEEADELTNAFEIRKAVIEPSMHGQRLDKALVEYVPEFSRSYVQQLLAAGLVLVNGIRANKASSKVKIGDAVEIELRPTPQSQAFRPEAMALDVVYEDADVLVINKAAGLVVHPAPGNWSGTLLNGLLARDPVFSLVPRAGIVHRLDKDTSGLMVVARHREAMDRLVQAMAAREISRQYLAIADKPWIGKPVVTVNAPIGRDPRNRLRMGVVNLLEHPGKPAQTDVHWLGNSRDGCFVRCVLHTGRTHQIRVHMASIGHPLLGDAVYGGASHLQMPRQALHATRLAFKHPISGLPLVFSAAMPADMCAVLEAWGLRYNAAQDTENNNAAVR
jgi:23S rRNA pseudouridine1911/1915/1917 synthase